MSAMGSVIRLPTGFSYAWDQSGQGRFAERQTRAGKLAQVTMTASTDAATVHHASGAGITRQLGKSRIILLRLEFGTQRSVLLHGVHLLLVTFCPGCFGHKVYFDSAKGMPISLSNSSASSSDLAEVTMVISIP